MKMLVYTDTIATSPLPTTENTTMIPLMTTHDLTTTSTTEAPHILEPTHPDLRLLLLTPLVFFILTSMIRRLRILSPFTTIAGCALLMGAIAVAVFLSRGKLLIE